MKKFVLVLLAVLAMPLFAEGWDVGNVFLDEENGPNGTFFVATLQRDSWPEGMAEMGVECCVMVYIQNDSTVYFMPFLHENDAAEFIGCYVAIANSHFSRPIIWNGLANLFCDYADKRGDKFAMGGKICCFVMPIEGKKSKGE